jgi:hypothetical protein
LRAVYFFFFPLISPFPDIPGQLRSHRWVKSAKQQEELFDHGKEMFSDGIGGIGIRVWNCSALDRWYRYD